MLLLDGKRLYKGKAFSADGVSYPANWLELTSREDHEAIGIVYVADQAPINRHWDERWAWGYLANGELNYKDYGGKKAQLISENDVTAGGLLGPTDYAVVRKYEKGTAIPADTSSFRDEVRRIHAARETAIEGTSTTEELYNVVHGEVFRDLPYPSGVMDWKATRDAAAAAAAAKAAAEAEAAESSESSESSGESSSESSEASE